MPNSVSVEQSLQIAGLLCVISYFQRLRSEEAVLRGVANPYGGKAKLNTTICFQRHIPILRIIRLDAFFALKVMVHTGRIGSVSRGTLFRIVRIICPARSSLRVMWIRTSCPDTNGRMTSGLPSHSLQD